MNKFKKIIIINNNYYFHEDICDSKIKEIFRVISHKEILFNYYI